MGELVHLASSAPFSKSLCLKHNFGCAKIQILHVTKCPVRISETSSNFPKFWSILEIIIFLSVRTVMAKGLALAHIFGCAKIHRQRSFVRLLIAEWYGVSMGGP